MSTVDLITSGKGGVGKSTLTSALGVALAGPGQKVCIVDTDIGLRGQDTLLGLQDQVIFDFLDVLQDNCELDDALIPSPVSEHLFLVCAPQFSRVSDLTPKEFARLIHMLRERFDRIFIDCPAGLEKGLRLSLKSEPDEVIVVCTPDDLCIRDAEQVVSLMREKQLPRPRLIVNRIVPELIESGEMYTPDTVAQTLDLELLGAVVDDRNVYRAQLKHLSVMQLDCEARRALLRIAGRMKGENIPIFPYGGKRSFLSRMLHPGVKEVVRIDV